MQYSHEDLSRIWAKGSIVPGNDQNAWRKDECGAWMSWSQYGNRDSEYGWEVDHIMPISKGGGDSLSNLRPLQWENNASRQDQKLVCVVTSSGKNNVRLIRR